jgi:glycosyltransferase involved in cell wall biosynthesis
VRVRGPRRPFSLWYPWFCLFGSLAVWRHRGGGLVHTTGALVANRADLSTVHFCHLAYHRRAESARAARASLAYRLNGWVAGKMSRIAERYCYRRAVTERLVAVSDGVARELRREFPAAAVSVVPNGVDTEVFAPDAEVRERVRAELGIDPGALVVLFVGGEWDRKGLRYAIEGVARAPAWCLVVVGGGDAERHAALAARAGAGSRVRFVGAVSSAAPYYPAADAFLLPTAYETFSLVTFEAAASGLPLLVSRASGVEEILVEGRNGWFVDRDAGMIAERLEALEDEEVRRSYGRAAREDSARFGWDRAVEGYDRLYREPTSR